MPTAEPDIQKVSKFKYQLQNRPIPTRPEDCTKSSFDDMLLLNASVGRFAGDAVTIGKPGLPTLISILTFLLTACGQGGAIPPSVTPEEIGAKFAENYGSVRDAEFDPLIPRRQAELAAVKHFMEGFNLRGVEPGLDVRSTTALFSGVPGGFGQWTIQDRQVWIVAIHDLPFSIPCGPAMPKGTPCASPPGRFSVAVDADTGEVLSAELSGAGPKSAKWGN